VERKKASNSDEATGREPYEPPHIVYREPLEAVANICNPGKADAGACPMGPTSS
jgi:hypothetical protein